MYPVSVSAVNKGPAAYLSMRGPAGRPAITNNGQSHQISRLLFRDISVRITPAAPPGSTCDVTRTTVQSVGRPNNMVIEFAQTNRAKRARQIGSNKIFRTITGRLRRGAEIVRSLFGRVMTRLGFASGAVVAILTQTTFQRRRR